MEDEIEVQADDQPEKIEVPKRSRRRAFYVKISRKVWAKARQRYAEDVRDGRIHHSLEDYYRGHIKNDGHWVDGGCSRTRCGLCQPREPLARDMRQEAMFDEELAAYWRGEG